jgi:hypothetical protein
VNEKKNQEAICFKVDVVLFQSIAKDADETDAADLQGLNQRESALIRKIRVLCLKLKKHIPRFSFARVLVIRSNILLAKSLQ